MCAAGATSAHRRLVSLRPKADSLLSVLKCVFSYVVGNHKLIHELHQIDQPALEAGGGPRTHHRSGMPTVTSEEPSGAVEDGKSMDEKHGDLLFQQVCRGVPRRARARERARPC